MQTSLIDFLRDPSDKNAPLHFKLLKGNERVTDEAILYDQAAKKWYWIEDGIGYFLPEDTTYLDRKLNFYNKHLSEFQSLDLPEPPQKISEGNFTELVKQQQEHFDWYAKNDVQSYEAYADMPFWKAVDETIFGRWLPQIKDNSLVLDMGCANGRSSRFLWERPIQIVGLDVSAELLVNYKQILGRKKISAEVSLINADAMHLPFAPAMFDAIVVYGVFHHVPEPSGAMSSLWFTLKPGGMLLSMENNRTIFRKMFDWLMRRKPIWHEEAGSQPCIGKEDVTKWSKGFDKDLKVKTSVWLPPHIINKFSDKTANKILKFTNSVGGFIPGLKNNGGLIEFEIHKKN
jgi:SAM-dependent methyltransferase/uncharacterized protein YbaR (Trm112 family)